MIKTTIEKEGQRFVDEPVYVEISQVNALAYEIAQLFQRHVEPVVQDLSHYNRVALRWLSLDKV